MEDTTNVTYDDVVQTKNVQILKSIVPFLDACSLGDGIDRRSAILGAIRQYCTPKEQETIDTLMNLFCVMDNYDMLNSL